jgi:hypothetical protein
LSSGSDRRKKSEPREAALLRAQVFNSNYDFAVVACRHPSARSRARHDVALPIDSRRFFTFVSFTPQLNPMNAGCSHSGAKRAAQQEKPCALKNCSFSNSGIHFSCKQLCWFCKSEVKLIG